MRLYCLSDLHLHDTRQRFLFTDEKEAAFVRTANEAHDVGATLLFAGDLFDLTGMQPPAKGMRDFFEGVIPGKAIDLPARRSIGDRIRGVVARYPRFFAALAPLAQQGRVLFIPGNHDHGIDSDEATDALGEALKVPRARLRFAQTLRAGAFFFGQHGHEFDPSNETLDGGDNPGAVIMSALYHAVVPALLALGVPEDVAHAIPCVRPEENIVPGLQGRLDPQTLHRLLLGFVKLLLENGYFVGHLERWKVHVATDLLTSVLLTPERVREALADDNALKENARASALAILKGTAPGFDPATAPEAVVLGHTHELDSTEGYVNLGTWIDHVRGLSDDDLARADRTLPVLVLDDDRKWARLHDVKDVVAAGSVKQCPVLWRFGVEL